MMIGRREGFVWAAILQISRYPQIHKNPIPRFIVPLTLTLLIKSIWELRWSEAEYIDQKKIFLDIYFFA